MSDNLVQVQHLWKQYLDGRNNHHRETLVLMMDGQQRQHLELNQLAIGLLLNLLRAEQHEKERQIPAMQLVNVSFTNENAADHFIRFMDAAQIEKLHIVCDVFNRPTTWLLHQLWKLTALHHLEFKCKSLSYDERNVARCVMDMLRHPHSRIKSLRFQHHPWNAGLLVGLRHRPSGLRILVLQDSLFNDHLFEQLVDVLLLHNVHMKDSLVSLDISGNKRIGRSSLPNLIRLLQQCNKLQELSVASCLFFGGLHSESEHYINFLETMRVNSTLTRLDLRSCGITKRDASRALFQMLEVNPTLQDMSINGFNAVPFLIQSLPKMKGLLSLSVRLTGASLFSSFLDALHQNISLLRLSTPRRDAYADLRVDRLLNRNWNLRKLSKILTQYQPQDQNDLLAVSTWPLCVESLMMTRIDEASGGVLQKGQGVDLSAVYGFLVSTSNQLISWI